MESYRFAKFFASSGVFAIFVFGAVLYLSTAEAQTTRTITVEVSISGVSQITVVPTYLTFYGLTPGSFSAESKIDIINTGSNNVSQIFAYPDTLDDEAVRPYGIANSTYYAAGGVLVIRNETNLNRFWAGRIEWNSTEDISNMVKTAVTAPAAWGFFRNTSFEYNWLVGNDTAPAGACNTTGVRFAIEDDVDNGTTASRTPTTTNIVQDGLDSNYVYFSIGATRTALPNHCVAVSADCSKIYVYKYDRRSGFSTCLNSNYLQQFSLQPGQVHTMNISAWIPLGIPATNGSLNRSTFTITAS